MSNSQAPDTTESDWTLALAALANGILPADQCDAGAATVEAGPRLVEKLRAGLNVALYQSGLQAAESLAHSHFSKPLTRLSPEDMHELIGRLRGEAPAFYKQLRLDVCALYLSDPGAWQRIGFPGPSADKGGYPDFDQPPADRHT